MARKEKLDLWIQNNLNVLFVGKHGVGKTSLVCDAFQRNNLNWRYFSASTMDPWVDFIGVPRESVDKLPESFEIIKKLISYDENLAVSWINNNWHMNLGEAKKIIHHLNNCKKINSYLDLVRPKEFAEDSVEALFFDEFNRSPKKVRNAVMELIQFKSINGKKFNNLRFVWAAINPEDDETELYDVEKIDSAQKDRFHIITVIPYEPNGEWFKEKFGERDAKIAISWWNELPQEQKNLVSPRRLAYILDVRRMKGDIRDVVHKSAGVGKLISSLNTGYMPDKLDELMKNNDILESMQFLLNENNYSSSINYILSCDKKMEFFLPLISKEKISSLISSDDNCCKYIIENSHSVPVFMEVCKSILKADTNTKIIRKIKRALTDNSYLAKSYSLDDKQKSN